MEKREPLQQMVLGKLENHMQQNEIKPLPLTLHKTQLKMDQGPQNQTRDPALQKKN